MSEENINPDAPLRIRGLNHWTIPVKERCRAARFYIVALGAEAHHESDPDRVAKGLPSRGSRCLRRRSNGSSISINGGSHSSVR